MSCSPPATSHGDRALSPPSVSTRRWVIPEISPGPNVGPSGSSSTWSAFPGARSSAPPLSSAALSFSSCATSALALARPLSVRAALKNASMFLPPAGYIKVRSRSRSSPKHRNTSRATARWDINDPLSVAAKATHVSERSFPGYGDDAVALLFAMGARCAVSDRDAS